MKRNYHYLGLFGILAVALYPLMLSGYYSLPEYLTGLISVGLLLVALRLLKQQLFAFSFWQSTGLIILWIGLSIGGGELLAKIAQKTILAESAQAALKDKLKIFKPKEEKVFVPEKPTKARKFVSWEVCVNDQCKSIETGGYVRIDENCGLSDIDSSDNKRKIDCIVPNVNGSRGPVDSISCTPQSSEKRLKFQYNATTTYEIICNQGDK